MNTSLSSKDFLFDLPQDRIAQSPTDRRGGSKLLVYKNGSPLKKSKFENLHTHLPKNALIVRNNSKVFQARLIFESPHGGKRELFFIRNLATFAASSTWQTLARPLKKIKANKTIELPGKLEAKIIESDESGLQVELPLDIKQVYKYLEEYGSTPLPPYIKREIAAKTDKNRYQNTYSKSFGSAAAPTAGLHLTSSYEQKLAETGVEFVDVELCVGGGTFLPVTSKTPEDHAMHSESYFVSKAAATKIKEAKDSSRPVFAMGTTSFRAIEDFALNEKDSDEWHSTNLFIYPKTRDDRHRSAIFDGIITNFHQPDSTLIMLMAGLVGFDAIKNCYEFALNEGFQFLSYGDSGLYFFD